MTLELAIAEIPDPWYLSSLHGPDPLVSAVWNHWSCTLRNGQLREIARGQSNDPVVAILEAISRIPQAEPEPVPVLFTGKLEQPISLVNLLGMVPKIRRRI